MGKRINLEVRIGKLQLKNPVVLCSGTAGYGTELKGLLDISCLGAVITKTITLHPRQGNPPPRIAEVSSGILNAIGLENPGLEVFLSKWKDIATLPTEIIVSIYGQNKEEFAEIITRLNSLSAIRAVELNLSCPNIKTKKIISQSSQQTRSLIKFLRKKTAKILIAKLTPEVTDIVSIARAARSAGADCLSLVNTFVGLKIDIEKRRPFLGNTTGGLSGPAIKPLALQKVYAVYKALKMPIIASGGVCDYKDALEFILSGAVCTGVGTANFISPQIPAQILKGLTTYMKDNKIYDLKALRGAAL